MDFLGRIILGFIGLVTFSNTQFINYQWPTIVAFVIVLAYVITGDWNFGGKD